MKAIIMIAVIFMGILWFAATANQAAPQVAPSNAPLRIHAPTPLPRQHEVIYKIEANKCSDFELTYAVPDGTSQRSATTCVPGGAKGAPVTVEVARFVAQPGKFVYLSMQNVGGRSASSSTTFSCNIYVDGVHFKHVESYGEHRIASCDGSIP